MPVQSKLQVVFRTSSASKLLIVNYPHTSLAALCRGVFQFFFNCLPMLRFKTFRAGLLLYLLLLVGRFAVICMVLPQMGLSSSLSLSPHPLVCPCIALSSPLVTFVSLSYPLFSVCLLDGMTQTVTSGNW